MDGGVDGEVRREVWVVCRDGAMPLTAIACECCYLVAIRTGMGEVRGGTGREVWGSVVEAFAGRCGQV